MTTTDRLFSPAEATETLPLVRRIVADILETGRALRAMGEADPEGWRSEPAAGRALREMSDLHAELESIGCSYRDWNFEIGLVDFPAIIDGEEVHLCWRSDEPELAWYHGVNAGFAGRKPIPEALLKHAPTSDANLA